MAAFCTLIFACALLHPGHGCESVDVRTYAQMIGGVAAHGLPYWDNGPVDRYDELVVPWAVPAGGHLWGVYGPLYAYVAAPAFLIGSLRAVSALTFACLSPIAIVIFLLARRLVRNEWFAVLASVLGVVSTPVLAKAVEISAYPLMTLLAATGTYCAVRVAERADAQPKTTRWSIGCGLSWGLAVASHAACFPMAIVSLTTVSLVARSSDRRRVATGAMLTFAATMVPLALLNRLRFHSYSPLSYGPIPWRHFLGMNPITVQNVSDQLAFAKPVLLFAAPVLAALLFASRQKRARVWLSAVAIAALVVAIAVAPVRERLFTYAQVFFGYFFDAGVLELGGPYHRAPDGIGQLEYGWVVRSTFQCTPILILAPVLFWVPVSRRVTLTLLAPSLALYAALALRANMGLADALGLPWAYLRYTLPALPMLVTASVVVVEHTISRFDWRGGAVATVSALAFGTCFLQIEPEDTFVKRVLLVIVPLVFALAALVSVLFCRHRSRVAAHGILALTLGLGVANGLAQEFRAAVFVKRGIDTWLDSFVRVMPARFAFFGPIGQLPDALLTTTVTHDVKYAFVYRADEIDRMRPVLELWKAEHRPIFVWWKGKPPDAWPDVRYAPVEGFDELYAVELAR